MSDFVYLVRYLYASIGWRLVAWLGLVGAASLLEGISISLILPILAGSATTTDSTLYQALTRGAALVGLPYNLWVAVIGMATLYSARTACFIFQEVVAGRITGSQLARMKIELVERVFRADYQHVLERGVSAYTNAATIEIGNVAQVLNNCARFMVALAYTFVYVALPLAINPVFTSVVIVVGIPGYFLIKRAFGLAARYSVRATAANAALQSQLVQAFGSLKYLKSTHGSGKITRRLSATSTEQGDLEYRQRALSAFVSNGAELFFMIVIAVLLLYYVEIARQEVIEILFILFIVRRGMNYALQAQNSFQGFLRYVGSARNFRELIRELEDNEEPTAPEGTAPDFDRPIALDGVTFRYGDGAPALDALSLEIPPRSTVAFVGASGAGKSTLATLLTGILPPTAGVVRVGDTPYGELDQAELRRQIGYVTQESVIFSDSVRNNITLWEGDGPDVDAAMREAAEAANIAEFIESLPDGYDTLLGEDGLNVSGGQRQRIAIARELYKSVPVLILDEATSALDSESESVVQQSIDSLRGDKTVIVIAHRLSTVRNADTIFVLREGRLVERGGYAALYARNGEFTRMVDTQSAAPDAGSAAEGDAAARGEAPLSR